MDTTIGLGHIMTMLTMAGGFIGLMMRFTYLVAEIRESNKTRDLRISNLEDEVKGLREWRHNLAPIVRGMQAEIHDLEGGK